MSQLKSLSDDIIQIKESIQQPLSVPQQCFAVYDKELAAAAVSQQASGWTQVQEHQTWKPDTAMSSHPWGMWVF